MAASFIESSAAVKLYLPERGSLWLQGEFEPSQGHVFLLVRIAAVEIVASLVRRARSGVPSPAQASSAIQALLRDLQREFQVVRVTENLIDDAMQVALRHGLRGYDCVQLAAALRVQRRRLAAGLAPVILVSADLELNAAAVSEGMRVEDPNTHP